MPNDITASRARELFQYDPTTGVLTWRAGPRRGKAAGCNLDGYIYVKVDGVMIAAHRIAWVYCHGQPLVHEGDHRDRNRSNNAISNLRDATPVQNRANSGLKSTNKSGFKGVCFDRRVGKYRADIRRGGKKVTLGYFENPQVASSFYQAAAMEAHGAFALVGSSNE